MKFSSFDSLEDMFAAMDRSRIVADESVLPYQAAARYGDFYRRTVGNITVYGELIDPIAALEADPDTLEEDVEYEVESRAEPEMRNYRFGRHYSIECPDGELGDVHVSQIEALISKDEFETAKAAGWPS